MLPQVLLTNGAELEQVNADVTMSVDHVDNLFAAAPRLQMLNTGVYGECTALIPLLRNDPPYGPLRVHELRIELAGADEADVLALAAGVATQNRLERLTLADAEGPRGLNALVAAAAEHRLLDLKLIHCDVDEESITPLARLLQRGSLTELYISSDVFPHAQETSMPVLCAALRACRTLTALELRLNPPGGASHRTVTALLDAVAALPALSELGLCHSRVRDAVGAGRALGALLAANLPSFRTLRVDDCDLGDEGFAPLLDGLASNTHLRELDCQDTGNDLSEEFERDRLEPALEALMAHVPRLGRAR